MDMPFCKLAISILFFLTGLSWASLPQLDASLLNKLDTEQSIVSQINTDRLSKTLVISGKAADGNLITVDLLDLAIIETIESGAANLAICEDLAKGDDKLRQVMLRVLAGFNISPNNAAGLVAGWAESKERPNSALRAVLANTIVRREVLQRLRSYFIENDTQWVRATSGIHELLNSDNEEIAEAMAISLSNASGTTIASLKETIKNAINGNISDRWLLSSNLSKLIEKNGAVANILIGKPLTGKSIYELVWTNIANKIARDPLLTTEYAKRSYLLMPLYEDICNILHGGLFYGDTINGYSITGQIVRQSSIPQSRYAWMANEIMGAGGAAALQAAKKEAQVTDILNAARNRLSALMQNDPAWCDMLLWHLTRVGEAATITLRHALLETIVESDSIAATFVGEGSPLGASFENMLIAEGAYSYYPGGGAELRAKVADKTVDSPALRRFMKAFANILATNDDAWSLAWRTKDFKKLNILQKIVTESIDKSTDTSTAWLFTIKNGNLLLKANFFAWLVARGDAPDMPACELWLESVCSALENGDLVGNHEVARLKEALIKYIQTHQGWDLIVQQIGTESFSFPYVIREALVESAANNKPVFWSMYRKLTQSSGDIGFVVRDELTKHIEKSILPSLILDETAAQNPYAADAGTFLWDKMLEQESPLLQELTRIISEGLAMNLAFGVANRALIDVLNDPVMWDKAKPYAASFFLVPQDTPQLKESTIAAMSNSAKEASLLTGQLVKDKDIREAWRIRMLFLAKFMGKAPPLAAVIRKDSIMTSIWRKEMARLATAKPDDLHALINALGMRRVGDSYFTQNIKTLQANINKTIFFDRVFIEQILVDKNRDYRLALLANVRSLFGSYIEQEWH